MYNTVRSFYNEANFLEMPKTRKRDRNGAFGWFAIVVAASSARFSAQQLLETDTVKVINLQSATITVVAFN